MLASLVRIRLRQHSARPIKAGGKRTEVVGMRITDAGRDALDRKWIRPVRHKNKRAAKRSRRL
jgi:hypothetical protein